MFFNHFVRTNSILCQKQPSINDENSNDFQYYTHKRSQKHQQPEKVLWLKKKIFHENSNFSFERVLI